MEHKIKPNKLLGQNFLTDKSVLKKIIETADLSPTDTVLEIGPGTGILTKELAQVVKRVIAVEKDPKMVKILQQELAGLDNVKIIEGDIRNFEFANLQISKDYKVVANIPYYLTATIIRKFLEIERPPEFMVLMLQKEVAERICSKPGKMSLLAVSVQFYADAKIVSGVSKNCFWPAPKIDSAIIKIIPFDSAQGRPQISPDLFFKIVKACFSGKRKQIHNTLTNKNNK